MDPEHHHARDPEKQNVVTGLEIAGRIELLERLRGLRPAEGRERPERAREPGVEDVGILRPAFSALGGPLSPDFDLAVRPVPRGNLMSPPELARDAPILDVLEEVKICLLPFLG